MSTLAETIKRRLERVLEKHPLIDNKPIHDAFKDFAKEIEYLVDRLERKRKDDNRS